MIKISVYPSVKISYNTLDVHIKLEFDNNLKKFWIIAWRLSRKQTRKYLLFAIQHIVSGLHISEYPLEHLRCYIKNHPELEKELNIDSEHIIIDKSVYMRLRQEE